jgi:hypothetical protein
MIVQAEHPKKHSITSTGDHTSTATSGKMLKADASGLPTDATNTDAQVSAAVTASHAAVTVHAPIVLIGQDVELKNNAGSPAQVTAIDIGTLANSDTVIPTSKAVTTALSTKVSGSYASAAEVIAGLESAKVVSPLTLVIPNWLTGLSLRNDTDTDHDIEISTGWAMDSTNVYGMRLSSVITKRIDASWAVGDDSGGLFSGSVGNATWYHVFIIRKDSDGTIDAGFDTSATAANKPAGYSNYRRIGSVLTNGSANIIQFYQSGDTFLWNTPIIDVNVENPGSSAVTRTISTPLGVVCESILYAGAVPANDGSYFYLLLTCLSTDDVIPSFNNGMNIGVELATGSYGPRFMTTARVLTNTSSQIRSRVVYSTYINIKILTAGWVDIRGK